jgi:IclR family acetate operon transcriptional repressor
VGRALDLLEALGQEELGLVELAHRANLHASTTHRMLATLTKRGYVQRRPSGLYALGRRAGYLGVSLCAREQAIKTAAQPMMRRVHRVSKQTVNLSVLEGDSIAFVAYLRGECSVTERPDLLPAHLSASGKLLMAYAPTNRRQARDQLPLTRAVSAPDRNPSELERTRQRGWATSRGEFLEDVACVACPIYGPNGNVVAAMSVAGPDERVTPDLQDLAELLLSATADVSHALGYLAPEDDSTTLGVLIA